MILHSDSNCGTALKAVIGASLLASGMMMTGCSTAPDEAAVVLADHEAAVQHGKIGWEPTQRRTSYMPVVATHYDDKGDPLGRTVAVPQNTWIVADKSVSLNNPDRYRFCMGTEKVIENQCWERNEDWTRFLAVFSDKWSRHVVDGHTMQPIVRDNDPSANIVTRAAIVGHYLHVNYTVNPL